MLIYKTGNLLDSDCQGLVNTINVVGIMGKGLALEFKNRYEEMFEEYKNQCSFGNIFPGHVWPWPVKGDGKRVVLNVATKDHWKNPSQYKWVWHGIYFIDKWVKYLSLKSIAIPPLGAGNGGLDKNKVTRIIELFHDIFWQKIKVEYYESK